jgi:diacylglycerol kinase family enzyme
MSVLGPVALVVNPVAMRTTSRLRAETLRALARHGLEWSLVTRGPGDAGRLAAQAAAEGARVVVTVGGDGTVAEAAGALAGGPVALVPLPGGNANVFARATGWPNDPHRALAIMARALVSGTVRDTRLGRLRVDGRDRVFVINAGMGLDAATVEWIETRPRLKRRLRWLGFALGAAVVTTGAGRRAPRLSACVDDGPPVDVLASLVACGTPYTYTGPRALDLVPGASFDGTVAWLGLTRVRPHELARLVALAAMGRTLPVGRAPLVGGPVPGTLVVRAEGPAAVQADGEPLGHHELLEVGPGSALRTLDPRSGGPPSP